MAQRLPGWVPLLLLGLLYAALIGGMVISWLVS